MKAELLGLIAALYRVLEGVESNRGVQRWFIEQLEKRQGLVISKATMSKWVNSGIPEDRREAVEVTVQLLWHDANEKLERKRSELETRYARGRAEI